MFKDKNVFVIGGTGTIGRALVKRLIAHKPARITVFSRNEEKQAAMQNEYSENHRHLVKFTLGSVEDFCALNRAMAGHDIVFHLAAAKHINLAEEQPTHAIKINVIGSLNVIKACLQNNVEIALSISTDKAVQPTSVYGMSKRLMEKMFLEQNGGRTKFFVVRFGNVFGSSGSVIERWLVDEKSGHPIKVTDPEMTRFFFGVSDAVSLMFAAIGNDDPTSIYTIQMKSCKIGDLAKTISQNIEIIGPRPGERKKEYLATLEEMQRANTFPYLMGGLNGGKWLDIIKIGPATHTTDSLWQRGYDSENAEPLSNEEMRQMLDELETLKYDLSSCN